MSPNYNYDVPKQLNVLWESRLWDLFAKKETSVTLFLKSLNDYKHFILKTTLKKIYKTVSEPVARILEVRARNPLTFLCYIKLFI